ncbi:CotH kinase family protein [candidate division KSB1 bacterium]|nr:CotH kinase family protein [candidate division KSB1 bacterium]
MKKTSLIRSSYITLLFTCIYVNHGLTTEQTSIPVIINEILASSHSLTLDPDYSQFADWIELYNTSNNPVDLGNCYLTDEFSQPNKWHIPPGTTIPARGYLLFWADGMDDGLHTNFKLSNDGEAVGLYAADGTVIDTLLFGQQVSDVSLGRDVNNPDKWLYYDQPTPDQANTTAGLMASFQAGNVQINQLSGFYSGSLQVSMSTSNAVIRYTTDGSTPTRTSREYTSPLTFSSTTIIKARSFGTNLLPGPVETRTFFINEHTTLPTFSLTTDPDFLWDPENGIYVDENIAERKSWERPAMIEFFETNGRLAFVRQASIRLFGRTAIYIPQKSLSLFLSDRLDYPLFHDIDVHEFDSFLLRSSSDDWHQTMFRDGFVQKMIRDNMSVDTQAYRPAVLFINGDYWGIHNIREKYNESYVETHHDVDRDRVDILYIDEREQDIEVLAGDRTHYDALIDFIDTHDLSVQENYNVVASLVDIDNLIDYVIAEAYIGNRSWSWNIRAWRPRTTNGKWRWMIFDLDRGFRYDVYNSLEEMANRMHPFNELLANDKFKDRFINRFVEYINTEFEPNKVAALLDSLQNAIAGEMPNHIERWRDFCGNGVCGIPSMIAWQEVVDEMRNIVHTRPATVREQLIDLFDLNEMVQLDVQVQPQGYGYVHLGQQTTITDSYSGQFFQDMTVLLQAQPYEGYGFVGWWQNSQTVSTLLNRGANWKFFDKGVSPGANWSSPAFDDSGWATGAAQLGYGDGDENTVVDYGPNSDDKYVTTYFRSSFQVTDVSAVQQLIFKLLRDDGAVVYLNGQQVLRSNMPGGSIQYDTRPSNSVGGDDEDTFFEFTINKDALVRGKNVVAVEVHQYNGTSSDMSFDLEIDALSGDGSAGLISENPQLTLELTTGQALTAVFSYNAQNELPAYITQNTILTGANSPYFVLQDVVVSPNTTLTLTEGTHLQLAAGSSLIVNGRLVAHGSAAQPVVLRGIGDNRWGALCFQDATAASTLSHVNITGATTGSDAAHFKAAVSTWNSDVTLDYIRIEHVNQPFYANGGTIVLTNSTLDGIDSGDDIANIQYASARVENCHLFGNGELDFDAVDQGIIRNNRIDIISTNSNRDGIDIGASDHVLIENNRIFDCPDKGISVGENSADTIIRGNLVVNAAMGVAVKDDSYARIDHTTFYNDSVGVACYEKMAGQGGGTATVTNSIFAGHFASEFTVDGTSSIQINYSLSEWNLMQGLGNHHDNARFVDPLTDNFYLQMDSPCIDAGDPTAPKDPDGSLADIGAFFYNKGPINTTDLVINEFLADNSKTLADEIGQFDDWIELYNGSDQPINVAGLYLTDNFYTPALWRIAEYQPETTTIAPGGYLLVWADKEMHQGLLHADMKLDASGEHLALIKLVEGQPVYIDSISFGRQQQDISRGRSYDGAVSWRDFAVPTPGQANDPLYTQRSHKSDALPKIFALQQNYPNPFNPRTTIVYQLPLATDVTVEVFNSLGQRVDVLVRDHKEAGVYRATWPGLDENGRALSSGLYFYKMTAGDFSAIRKMILMR